MSKPDRHTLPAIYLARCGGDDKAGVRLAIRFFNVLNIRRAGEPCRSYRNRDDTR